MQVFSPLTDVILRLEFKVSLRGESWELGVFGAQFRIEGLKLTVSFPELPPASAQFDDNPEESNQLAVVHPVFEVGELDLE